jgi:SAM-dependent methyltransferase
MTIPLVDPDDRQSVLTRDGDVLISAAGRRYPVVEHVADFTRHVDEGQQQTANSFGFKWTSQPDWGFTPEHRQVMRQVWADVFGWTDEEHLSRLMRDRVVLDAGCGSGASLNQWVDLPRAIAAVDISEAVHACHARFHARPNITFARADLTRLPFADDTFDVIWSAGVLHHTPDTYASLAALVRHLKPGGRVVVYVYVRKPPIREFVDDYLRAQISDLPPEDAWRRMEALTRFARSLAAVRGELVIEEDVPELGFRTGTYDVQRFVYYHLFKCFWNDALGFDDNVHVNFDWYHPKYAHRHSPEEVRAWLPRLGLEAEHFHVSASGIAVVARRTGSKDPQ